MQHARTSPPGAAGNLARSVAVGFGALGWWLLAAISCAQSTPTPSADAVRWQPQWRKVQPVEYVATIAFAATTLGLSFFVDPPTNGHHGGYLYDDALRSVLRLHTRSGRDAARLVGDTGFRTMLIFPFVDAALSGWLIRKNPEVAWQMLSMDAEALAVAGFFGVITDHFIGRARPSQAECAKDPNYERFCNQPDSFSSFVSGHSVIAAAGAGVTCAHHLNMPLYGGGAADPIACAASITVALATGIARMANDRHWGTDVTVAFLLGGFAGYAWPKWFHYRSLSTDPDGLRYTWLPSIGPGQAAATLLGVF